VAEEITRSSSTLEDPGHPENVPSGYQEKIDQVGQALLKDPDQFPVIQEVHREGSKGEEAIAQKGKKVIEYDASKPLNEKDLLVVRNSKALVKKMTPGKLDRKFRKI
jgi:hypothetical protein